MAAFTVEGSGGRLKPGETASGKYGQFSLWSWLSGKGNESAQSYQTNERLAAQDFNSAEAAKARQFEHDENALARDWQERMSNTALQRQMNDAKAAGINPMYLLQGSSTQGAGVPMASGSTSAQNATSSPSGYSDNSGQAVASAVAAVAKIVAALV